MRDVAGRFAPGYAGNAIDRFKSRCKFDPTTGCVLWIGGTTRGRGHSSPYGSFWFDGRRWFAHRWAAAHIHGLVIDGLQVDHCCPHGPNTLCVQHVQSVTADINRALQWIRVQVGIDPPPTIIRDSDLMPFYNPPVWLCT